MAAHLSKEEERIIDFTSILEEQYFQLTDSASDSIKILDHDYVIIAGDLNFRLDDISRDEVLAQLALIDENGTNNNNENNNNNTIKDLPRQIYDKLLVHDQLRKAFKEEKCFEGFEEAQIDFKPTYKFDKHDRTQWDQSEKQRKPAWTDRILWRAHPGKKANAKAGRPRLSVESCFYGSNHAFIQSDHKPVFSKLKLAADNEILEDNVGIEPFKGKWKKGEDGICRVKFPTGFEPGKKDWVGIFRADQFSHLKSYITWYWVSSGEKGLLGEQKQEVRQITFDRKYLETDDLPIEGKHVMVYVSEDYDNVYGVSPVFDIV